MISTQTTTTPMASSWVNQLLKLKTWLQSSSSLDQKNTRRDVSRPVESVFTIAALIVSVILLLLSQPLIQMWRGIKNLHFYASAEVPRLYFQDTKINRYLMNQIPLLTKDRFYPSWYLLDGNMQTGAIGISQIFFPQLPTPSVVSCQNPITDAEDNKDMIESEEKVPKSPAHKENEATERYKSIRNSIPSLQVGPKINYKREMFNLSDGGQLALDWAHPGDDEVTPRPTIVIIHGLVGHSQEMYMRYLVSHMLSHGWRCCVKNWRGCGDTLLTTPRMNDGGISDDLREVVRYIRDYKMSVHAGRNAQAVRQPLVGASYSLGTHQLIKYLGEEGEESLLDAGVTISSPYSLKAVAQHHDGNLLTRVFAGRVAAALAGWFVKKSNYRDLLVHDAVSTGEQEAEEKVVNLDSLVSYSTALSCNSMRDFDEKMCSRFHGHGYAEAYYAFTGSEPYLPRIKVPLLMLSALDDPICPGAVIPYEQIQANPNLILVTTKRGGHIAFFYGQENPLTSLWRRFFPAAESTGSVEKNVGEVKMWASDVAVEFFQAFTKSGGPIARVAS